MGIGLAMNHRSLRILCLFLSAFTVFAGGAGMTLSFLFLASSSHQDAWAGAAGFIAGAVLIGAGLIAMAILVSAGQGVPSGRPDPDRPIGLRDNAWKVQSPR
jgi:hypothetical protein